MPYLKGSYKKTKKNIKKIGKKIKPKIDKVRGVGTRYNKRLGRYFKIRKPKL